MSKPTVLLIAAVAVILGHLALADNEVETVFKNNEIVPDVINDAPQQFLKVISKF